MEMVIDKNIFDEIPCDKELYFLGSIYDLRHHGSEMFDCQVGSASSYYPDRTCYLLWDNPKSLLEAIESEEFKWQIQGPDDKFKIDAASLFCLLWYHVHKYDKYHKNIRAELNPGADFFTTWDSSEQKISPQNTKLVFPYIEKHLENISGQQIAFDKREELLKRIEGNNLLPPKVVLRYFPFWEESKSEEYAYSIIYTGIRCESEEFIDITFSRERSRRLQAIELLGSPEDCSKCGDNSWCFISLSSNKKASKWKCNFCNSTLLLRTDSPKDKKGSNGSKRKPVPKDVQREVWRRDQGQCVECGSQERLEFDHVIPVSKGGANTVRNLQLLCESCNRRKSGKAPGHN